MSDTISERHCQRAPLSVSDTISERTDHAGEGGAELDEIEGAVAVGVKAAEGALDGRRQLRATRSQGGGRGAEMEGKGGGGWGGERVSLWWVGA